MKSRLPIARTGIFNDCSAAFLFAAILASVARSARHQIRALLGKRVALTNIEDTAQATWLRSAPNILFNGVVIYTGGVMSFILDKPVGP